MNTYERILRGFHVRNLARLVACLAVALGGRVGAASYTVQMQVHNNAATNMPANVVEGTCASPPAGPQWTGPNPYLAPGAYSGYGTLDVVPDGRTVYARSAGGAWAAVGTVAGGTFSYTIEWGGAGWSPGAATNVVYYLRLTNYQAGAWYWRALDTNGTPQSGWYMTEQGDWIEPILTNRGVGPLTLYGTSPGVDGYQLAAMAMSNTTSYASWVTNGSVSIGSLGITNWTGGSPAVGPTNRDPVVKYGGVLQSGDSTNAATGGDVTRAARAIITGGAQAAAGTEGQARRGADAAESASNTLAGASNNLAGIEQAARTLTNQMNEVTNRMAGLTNQGIGTNYTGPGTNWLAESNAAWAMAESTGYRGRLAASMTTNLVPSGDEAEEDSLILTLTTGGVFNGRELVADFRPSVWPIWLIWTAQIVKAIIALAMTWLLAVWVREQIMDAYDWGSVKATIAAAAPTPQGPVGVATWGVKKIGMAVVFATAVIMLPAALTAILEGLGPMDLIWLPDLIAAKAEASTGGSTAKSMILTGLLLIEPWAPWGTLLMCLVTQGVVWITRGSIALVVDCVILRWTVVALGVGLAGSACGAGVEVTAENLRGTNVQASNSAGAVVLVPPGVWRVHLSAGDWIGAETTSVIGARGTWRLWQGGSDYEPHPIFSDGVVWGLSLGLSVGGLTWVFAVIRRLARTGPGLGGES